MATMVGHNLTRVKNRSQILKLIWRQPNISRVEVASTLSLSEATVSRAVRDLVGLNLVREAEETAPVSRPGKTPAALQPYPSTWRVLSVYFGVARITVSAVSLDGTICRQARYEPRRIDVATALDLIEDAFDSLDDGHLFSVGVSVSGVVDGGRGRVGYSSRYQWRDVPLKDLLEERLQRTCFVTNDTKAAILGEQWIGEGKGADDLVYVLIGEGLGMAMLLGGHIVEGGAGMAGELSAAVAQDGQMLGEAICSKGIREFFQSRVSSGESSSLAVEEADLKSVLKDAAAGDTVAGETIDMVVEHIAPIIYNTILMVDPRRVVMGGNLGESGSFLIERIRGAIRRYEGSNPSHWNRLVLGRLGEGAPVVGAAWLGVRSLLNGTPATWLTVEEGRG